jgi:SulP family sulfate permease
VKRSHQRTASASLDGVAVVVPTALGSTALVYAQVSPDMLIYGVHACMLALVWIHVITARAQRPMLYSARFFEATTLAVMLRQIIDKLPGWNLPDTAGVRLAFLCLIGAAAGLWVGCLWWMRAQRFTRYIPAPVYAGFANSIALVLVISQAQVFVRLLDGGQPLTVIGSIAGGTILAGVAARHLKPDWPSTSVALIAGVLISLAWLATGYATPMVSQGDTAFTLPVSLADFTALTQPAVVHAAVIEEVLRDAMILGTVIFLNTTVTGQFLAQGDDRTTYGGRDSFLMAFSMMLAGVIGSAPVSGATQASITASRYGRLRAPVLLGCTLLLILLYLSGLLGWVPIAAIAGSLFFEAWLLYDRPSFRQLGRWLKRLPMAAAAREDLLLIVTVTLVTVLVNILTAAFVGLTLGLVLYAARNSRQPLRHVWSGTQVSSNCARSRADLRLLAEHAGAIKVFELEGDQFFASAAALNHAIRAQLDGVECAVIDWSRVRHIDTSIAQTIDRLESHASNRSIRLLHASACREVALMLSHIPEVVFAPDLDRALETAENRVIQMHAESRSSEVTSLVEAVSMFRGMGPIERRAIEGRMVQRVYPAGEVIVRAGDPSDALLLVMEGTASVLMHNPGAAPGKNVPDIRLAGVRRGATIGEIGFLDGEPRSATVVAQDDVLISSITREAFDELSASHPHLVQRLLSNITVDLATRLRHTNQHALAKMGKT